MVSLPNTRKISYRLMADKELEEKWGGGSGGSSLTKANHLSQKLDPVSLVLEI